MGKYYRAQVLLEPEQHQIIQKFAQSEKRSVSDVIREMLREQIAERQHKELHIAAQKLLPDYTNDAELTAFTSLDSEDFHA